MNILIIEDDDSIRESLDMYLTEEGCDVEVADMGWEGVRKFSTAHVALVILDVHLPDLNGFDVLDKLIKHDGQARVIMITAFHYGNTMNRAFEKGVCKYIKKPIDVNLLDNAIVEALK